jgi:D-serine deaminase-like pyridoxal phosphate-dependent protein
MYQRYRASLAGWPLPLAFIDQDLLDQNIRQIADRAAGKRIRVASKSIRCRAVLERVLSFGSPYAGVMCYSIGEAAWLASQGMDDLLVGYPGLGREAILAVCEQIRAGRLITLMVDSPEQIAPLAKLAESAGVQIPLCLDLDLSVRFPGLHFGMLRSPITTPEQALVLLAEVQRHATWLRLDGLMGYEGQIAGVPDAVPGQGVQNALIRLLKQRSIPQIAERRAAVVAALAARTPLRFVNGGGTGSLASTSTEACVTELTAGSGFFAPHLFDGYQEFRYQPAAGFALEVVRQPAAGVFTCFSGGYIASGSAGPAKLPRPYLPAGAMLTDLEGAGEVQTPVRYTGPEAIQLGDPIFFRHAKAGELCERFDRLVVIATGAAIVEFPTYRGEGQNWG